VHGRHAPHRFLEVVVLRRAFETSFTRKVFADRQRHVSRAETLLREVGTGKTELASGLLFSSTAEFQTIRARLHSAGARAD